MIKLCGLRRSEDIEYVNEFMPDYAGFILAEGYRRTVSSEQAGELIKKLSPDIKPVGVFVNQSAELVSQTAEKLGLYACQLHGDENQDYIKKLRSLTDVQIWKAARVRSSQDIVSADSLGADMLVLDSFSEKTYGGTGMTYDWNLIRQTDIKTRYFLAGGINIENIYEALEITFPENNGIDISGGVETNGIKDRNKIAEIMNAVRNFSSNYYEVI